MDSVEGWTEADLQRLVDDKVQESLTLDYKRLASLNDRKEISKDVSAFANSAGGRIIYGIQEKDQLPTQLDDDQSAKAVTRETLENVITSTINPRVAGLVIKPIPLASGSTAFVIDIPQATVFAPHQAHDNRYYRRRNFKSDPMEDYEVRDALRRSHTPHLVVYANWRQDRDHEGNDAKGFLSFSIENLGDEPALYTALQIYVDQRLTGSDLLANEQFEVSEAFLSNGTGKVWLCDKKLMIPNHIPLFKGRTWNVGRISIPVPPSGDYFVGYYVSCPGFAQSALAEVNINAWDVEPRNEDANKMLANIVGLRRWPQ